MKQREMELEDLFRDFQTTFNQAEPEEKNSVTAQMSQWVGELVDKPGILNPDNLVDNDPADIEDSVINSQNIFLHITCRIKLLVFFRCWLSETYRLCEQGWNR